MIGELELSVKCEVPGGCDVELHALLGAFIIDRQEPLSSLSTEMLQVVDAMGGCRQKCARERRSSVRRLVSEIYSPPRVTAAAKVLPSLVCTPGFAMDLTTKDENGVPWDFDIPEQRRRARERVERERPMLLIGSPMCTAFNAWQRIHNMKRDPEVVRREYLKAMIHIRFTMELYEMRRGATSCTSTPPRPAHGANRLLWVLLG